MIPGPNSTAESIIKQLKIKFPEPLRHSTTLICEAEKPLANNSPANSQTPRVRAPAISANMRTPGVIESPTVTPAFKTQMQNPHKRIKITSTTPIVIDQNSHPTVNNSTTTAAAPLSIEDRLAQLESRILMLEAKNAVLEANNAQMKEQLLSLVAEKSACRM